MHPIWNGVGLAVWVKLKGHPREMVLLRTMYAHEKQAKRLNGAEPTHAGPGPG